MAKITSGFKMTEQKEEWADNVNDVIPGTRLLVKPGLSSFADNLPGIEVYLRKLIDGAKDVVPSDVQASTPILLMATAGMRLLTLEQQNNITTKVRQVFKDKNICPFQFKEANVRVITGTEEAVYGWITVNFLKGAFFEKRKKTYGTLELGGASTQISFIPLRDHVNKIIKIAGKIYHLYAKSYLGYGAKELEHRFIEYMRSHEEGVLKSPCHHNGYEETLQLDGKQIQLVGVADYRKCAKMIDQLFFCSDPTRPCPFRNQPRLKGKAKKFYAFSVFHNILKGIGALHNSSTVSVGDIKRSAKEFCNKKYDEVKADKYAKENCLAGVYVHELFRKGYRVKGKFKATVVEEIGGFKVNWILGSMLYKMNLL